MNAIGKEPLTGIPLDVFAAQVPRYTSYPTAPHFHSGIGADTYRRWLAELPPGMPLSLYLHIPFCDTLCWFCGCHTSVVNTYSPVRAYLPLLLKEMEQVSRAVGRGHPVPHIHFGGGSPTLLAPDDLREIGRRLRQWFDVSSEAEIAVEIDPRGLSDATIEALADLGVSRASIGVQDNDAEVQRAINRTQPFAVTKSAVERLRAHGIQALNIDLVYGLPHQTTERLLRSIADVLTLAPDRFAVFGYAHVPHFKKHQRLIDEAALPGQAGRLEQFESAHAAIAAAGYVPIGLDHFARPEDAMARAKAEGRLARNFQGYTTDDAPALIGLGASAIGALPQGYVQNAADVPGYRRAIEAGSFATARGIALSNDDRLRRAVIERLMCDLRVDLGAQARRFDCDGAIFAEDFEALEPLCRDGLVSISGSVVEVPPHARAAVRLVCAVFDCYLRKAGAKHSASV